jgi:hypothetical protein
MNTMLTEILIDSSYLFITIGAFIALTLGFGLIFAPSLTLKLNEKINTRVSLREKTKAIETAIKSEPFFYKYSKISGAILVLGSIFVLYTLTTFNAYSLIPHLPKSITPQAWEWVIDSAQIFFFITCSFILIFGLIIFIRPSLVKGFEETANHWISTRKSFSKMSTNIDFTNKLVNAYPRVFGAFIVIFSLFVLFLLLPKN